MLNDGRTKGDIQLQLINISNRRTSELFSRIQLDHMSVLGTVRRFWPLPFPCKYRQLFDEFSHRLKSALLISQLPVPCSCLFRALPCCASWLVGDNQCSRFCRLEVLSTERDALAMKVRIPESSAWIYGLLLTHVFVVLSKKCSLMNFHLRVVSKFNACRRVQCISGVY
jgi:hypothetical protein